jgi:hypothetical protein
MLLSLLSHCSYCLCPTFLFTSLLSDVASLYAIVWTPYYLIAAIVSGSLIVITYAYYWVV